MFDWLRAAGLDLGLITLTWGHEEFNTFAGEFLQTTF